MPTKFSGKGNIFVKVGEEYKFQGELDTKTNYENSFNIISLTKDIDLSKASKSEIKTFLESATSESKAQLLVDGLDDPIKVLEEQDFSALTKIKGIGQATAEQLIDRYFAQKDFSEAYIALSKYGLTTNAIQKVCRHFGSPDKAIAVVRDNPYELTQVDGYGFSRADSIFLSDEKNTPVDNRRVEAYIEYMFEKLEEEGDSWMAPEDFIKKIKEFIPNADLEYAVKHVQSSSKYVYKNIDGDKMISTERLYSIEKQIAHHINRLKSAECDMDLTGWEEAVERIEKVNGWQYNDEQRQAIESMINENVFMLQGLAGSGKSTTVSAIISAVQSKSYMVGQTALSGKAADNLTKVTGMKGHTIHSLLGYSPEKNGFEFDEKEKLPHRIIVLDELSMVNTTIFLDLLKAIKTGSKLIMIGDYGQLEAIGVGVMGGLIRSKQIPMTLLKRIHRQSQESAIITHSISVRSGVKPKELKDTAGLNDIYGIKEDLEYLFVDNDSERDILKHSLVKFKEALNNFSIDDIQIICSTKKSGVVSTYELNEKAQMIYNPDKGQPSIELGFKEYRYELRVGDKVINVKNNRNTLAPDGAPKPIFNGNTGVIKEINSIENSLIVEFDNIGEVVVEGESVKNIELGYAITTHKSQGSTIKCVIFALPFHYLLNTKELVYTGMTRASDYQVIITSPRSLRRSIKNTSVSKKRTHLERLLKDNNESS